VNQRIDVRGLPLEGSDAVDLVSQMSTAVGELARGTRSQDAAHVRSSVAAVMRIAAAILDLDGDPDAEGYQA
jgi:hypothetical protein